MPASWSMAATISEEPPCAQSTTTSRPRGTFAIEASASSMKSKYGTWTVSTGRRASIFQVSNSSSLRTSRSRTVVAPVEPRQQRPHLDGGTGAGWVSVAAVVGVGPMLR